MDKNIIANCKPLFNKKEILQGFYNDWYKILYANTEFLFQKTWTKFKAKYNIDYWVAIDYLCNNLLNTWKKKVLNCYTNNFIHFGNITTLRAENGYAKIKYQLNNTSTDMII